AAARTASWTMCRTRFGVWRPHRPGAAAAAEKFVSRTGGVSMVRHLRLFVLALALASTFGLGSGLRATHVHAGLCTVCEDHATAHHHRATGDPGRPVAGVTPERQSHVAAHAPSCRWPQATNIAWLHRRPCRARARCRGSDCVRRRVAFSLEPPCAGAAWLVAV